MKISIHGAAFATKTERSDVLAVMAISTAILAGRKVMGTVQDRKEGIEQCNITEKDRLLPRHEP
jgi:hypothetical protein